MGEKTLPPSQQRLRQAREDGQVGVSQDAVRIIRLLVMAEFAFAMEPYWRRLLAEMIDTAMRAVSHPGSVSLKGASDTLWPVVICLVVLAVLPMALAIIGTLAQTRFNVAPKALTKGVDKLNPGSNMKQLVSPQKLLMPLLGPVKGGLLLWMVYLEIREQLPLAAQAYRISPAQGWSLTMELLHALMRQCVVVLLLLLITDILLQRYMTWRQLRMDQTELKRDYKQNEGDPMLKGMRKQTAKEIALSDSPPAQAKQRPSAVVVNPQHIAVALLYEPEEMDLPVLLQAASDDEARALRHLARREGIPVIRYVALARHLMASGRAGDPIPEHTYRAAALLFKVIEEYERLAPELLRPGLALHRQDRAHPEGEDEDAADHDSAPQDDPDEVLDEVLAEVDDELGASMLDGP